MLKGKIVLVSVVVIIISFLVWLLFIKNPKKDVSPAINAVPIDATYVAEISHFPDITESFSTGNKIWGVLSELPSLDQQQEQLSFIDSLFKQSPGLKKFLNTHSVIMSAHTLNKSKIAYLFAVNLVEENEKKQVHKLVAKTIKGKAEIKRREYSNSFIYTIIPNNPKYNKLQYSFYKGILLISFEDILIEESIRQLNTNTSLLKNQYFRKLSRTINNQSIVNIYINLRQYMPYLLRNFNIKNSNLKAKLEKLGFWTMLDADFKTDALSLKGFTMVDDSSSNYLNIFKDQVADNFDFQQYIPQGTAFFMALNISNPSAFKKEYKNYLRKSADFYDYQNKIRTINVDFDTDIESTFYNILKSQTAVVYTNNLNSSTKYTPYWLLKVNDTHMAQAELQKIITKYALKNNVELEQLKRTIEIEGKELEVNFFPIDNFAQTLLGDFFSGVWSNFYIQLDDYLIFGRTLADLSEFASYYYQKKTLAESKNFEAFSDNINSQSTVFIYSAISRSEAIYNDWLSTKANKEYITNTHIYNKFEAWSVQISSSKKMQYTNIYMNFNPAAAGNAKIIWDLKLDSLVTIKPQIVKNHNTGYKEIVLQDKSNNLYLIDRKGKILWKKQLPEQIISKIYQIDYYQNNKLQMLFNTERYIFLLDRNGKNVEQYPVRLEIPASNGLAVFDYDRNRDYRILLATKNKEIKLLDKDGKNREGWEFGKTTGVVDDPIHFHRLSGKDYIVFSDSSQIYFLDRRGNTRLKPAFNIKPAIHNKVFVHRDSKKKNPFFITNGRNGTIYLVYQNGTVKKMKFEKYSTNHYFDYIDINGDKKQDFVFFDNNQVDVFNRNKKGIFSTKFNAISSEKPDYYAFSESKIKMGFHCLKENKIYLLNPNGKPYKGFPLEGQTQFSISFLSKQAGKFNLIVGAKGNKLYNYQIQ